MTRPTSWQPATVRRIVAEAPRTKTFRLALSRPCRYLAGQHYVVRLTAPDGYRAQRSYPVTSAPGPGVIDLAVWLSPGCEVSEFLHGCAEVGDELEVRGPIGGLFAWDGASPILGVAGGSGVVPLISMIRHARKRDRPDLVRALVSVRRRKDLCYSSELTGPYISVVYTRHASLTENRAPGRITAADLAPLLTEHANVYVCGTSGFCDTATGLLLELGVGRHRVRTERFGRAP